MEGQVFAISLFWLLNVFDEPGMGTNLLNGVSLLRIGIEYLLNEMLAWLGHIIGNSVVAL